MIVESDGYMETQLSSRVGGEKDHAVYPLLGSPIENMRDGAVPFVSHQLFSFSCHCELLSSSQEHNAMSTPLTRAFSLGGSKRIKKRQCKARNSSIDPRSPLCPGKMSLQQHYWGQHYTPWTLGRALLFGQIENDLGKCRSHSAPFADPKLWLERSRIKNKSKSYWSENKFRYHWNVKIAWSLHSTVWVDLRQRCDLGKV